MKKIAIFAFSLFASSFALAANHTTTVVQNPDTDLCDRNLEQISNYRATDAATMGEPNKSRIQDLRSQAQEFRRNGDIRNCISVTEQALNLLRHQDSN